MDRDVFLNEAITAIKALLNKRRKIDKSVGMFIAKRLKVFFRENPSEPMTPLLVEFVMLVFALEDIRQSRFDMNNFVKYLTIAIIISSLNLRKEYESVASQIPRLIVREGSKCVPEDKIVEILKGFSRATTLLGWKLMWEKGVKNKIELIVNSMITGLDELPMSGKKKEIWLQSAFGFWTCLNEAIFVFVFVDNFWPLGEK